MRGVGVGVVFVGVIRMRMVFVRMRSVMVVGVGRIGWGMVGGDDVDFGGGEAAAADLAHVKMRADIEGGGGFFKDDKGNARVDESAEQHVAANAGKTLKISNTHGSDFKLLASDGALCTAAG